MSRLLVASLTLAFACQDVSIGRQTPRDASVGVRRERVLPMPDADLTLRAFDVGPGGEWVVLAQFTGSADFGDGDVRTATSDGGDGVLLVLEPDGALRAKRVLAADFLTLYRAVVGDDAIHITGLFRGTLSDGDPVGDAPAAQTAIALSYTMDGTRSDARVLGAGFGNVQGKGIAGGGGRLLRCGNYLGDLDAGDGALPSAGATSDNGYVTLADGATTTWTEAIVAEDDGRGAFVQNCAFGSGGAFAAMDFGGTVEIEGSSRVSDGLDAFVIAYDDDGASRWARSIGGPGDQQLNPLATNSAGVFVGGSSSATFTLGAATVDPGGFVAALDLDGEPRWVWSAGVRAVTGVDASGSDTVVSGLFDAPVTRLGWDPVGERDGFVAGLDATGAIRWSHTFGSGANDSCLGHESGSGLAVVCVFGGSLESPGGTAIGDGGALWLAVVER
ncbi:MAG: hypothetical protein JJ863_36070 [Deltaproteobacteria bacterium]|nr:hypothetical protein [Deltaproteobacteria bacterium]